MPPAEPPVRLTDTDTVPSAWETEYEGAENARVPAGAGAGAVLRSPEMVMVVEAGSPIEAPLAGFDSARPNVLLPEKAVASLTEMLMVFAAVSPLLQVNVPLIAV